MTEKTCGRAVVIALGFIAVAGAVGYAAYGCAALLQENKDMFNIHMPNYNFSRGWAHASVDPQQNKTAHPFGTYTNV